MTNALESTDTFRPGAALWSGADEQFFRIVAELFRPALLQGATVLLASYDAVPEFAEAPA